MQGEGQLTTRKGHCALDFDVPRRAKPDFSGPMCEKGAKDDGRGWKRAAAAWKRMQTRKEPKEKASNCAMTK